MDLKTIIREYGGPKRVAREMGVSQQTLQQWQIRGRVPLERVEPFCNLVGCAPDEANDRLAFAVAYGARVALKGREAAA